MPIFYRHPLFLLLLLVVESACTGEDTPYFPGGGSSHETGEDTAPGSGGCSYSEWTWIGESLVDPLTCLAWGPKGGSMNWYAAVSPTEALAGGCTSHCDDDSENYCEDAGKEWGLSGDWALPSIANLEALAQRSPPFDESGSDDSDELSGDLWSRTSDENMNQLAWTADLTQPGMEIIIDKNSGAYVRCVLAIAD